MDYIGSQLTKLDFDGGEVEFNTGMGHVLLWQLGWKRDGMPPPQQSMPAAATPMVEALVVGVVGTVPGVPQSAGNA